MLYQGCFVRERNTALISILCGILTTLISISSLDAGSVTLAWDPSPDASVVAYKVYYGPSSRSYTNSIQVGNVTNASIAGLMEGATYYFGATALDNSGLESDFSNETVFTVPVPPGNQSPTLNTLASVTINESAGLQAVNLAGITSGATNEAQTLTVTATSSNPGLIPNPSVSYTSPNTTGSLTFSPVALAFGSAILTVTVNDGGASNNIVSRTFTVTVNSVNQAPTLTALANITINESAGSQTVNFAGISSGATNEAQTLTVTATSSNLGLIPNPSVNYSSPNATGSLTFTPVALAFGSATLTVTVNDGSASNNIITRTFTVTVNKLPTISPIADQDIAIGSATAAIPFTIGDNETSVTSLSLTASSLNPALVRNNDIAFGGAGSNRTLTITPLPGQSGFANITITVSDGTGSASRTFLLDVRPKPTVPANLRVVQATP